MTICEVEVFESNCEMGYFGDKCLRRCHCKGPCDVLSGNCNECDPGWYPPTCETACSQGYYGQNCSEECSYNCENNNCNSQNGSCMHGCKPGYDYIMSTNCSVECTTGSYGDKCSRNCSQHCIAEECQRISGKCNLGCKPGFNFLMDPNCESPCEDGTYGTNCNMKCGDCFPNKICDKLSGICPNGCMVGFKGTTCSEPEKEERRFTASEVAGMAAGSVGCCLLLVGLVHVCVLVYRRYKSASTKRDSTYVIPDVENTNTGRAYEGPYEMPLKNNDEHMYQTIQN
ncbi:scavenger receptor class F member 1-like isoform X1 [Mya arenaria]|uniref:scavenger receptor class F member 1-like isoform X1 n=1 Tax=Mya arenaria TaxID=6604 RepID=UPI0022E76206|nr:scavenger receptor class F member 1-like isoform X1 [Mya arenaria]